MTRLPIKTRARGLTVALIGGIAAAFMLATTPAQAQRTSLGSLAGDHDGLATDHDGIQAAIGALGAPAGDGRTPIGACGDIDAPGSYVVIQNLAAAGTCLNVTADHVTIDLGGFVISGDLTGDGITNNGTDADNRLDIAVHHGAVTGFDHGIDLFFVESAVVEGVRALGNAGTGISTGAFSTVTGNTANRNGTSGIQAGFGNSVTGNTASRNGFTGIAAGLANTVAGNTVTFNGGSGITAGCPSNVIGNTATNNTGANLVLAAACNDIDNVAP